MQVIEYKKQILIPHDTPVKELIADHNNILKETRQIFPQIEIFPFYPLHSILKSKESLNEIQKNIKSCVIEPPIFSQGFFIRPLKIEGIEIDFFPKEFFPNNCSKQLPKKNGFVFGFIKNLNNLPKEMETLDFSKKIQPISLRVFRLYDVIYNISIDNKKNPFISWHLSTPKWIKLH